jgi:hypothetical protein
VYWGEKNAEVQNAALRYSRSGLGGIRSGNFSLELLHYFGPHRD